MRTALPVGKSDERLLLGGVISNCFDFLSNFPLLLKADISNQVTNAPCLPMSPEDFSLIKMYYHFIYHRYLDAECPSEVIKGMLFSLVLEVCRMYSGRNISVEMSRQDKLVDGFFSLLHKYCTQERRSRCPGGRNKKVRSGNSMLLPSIRTMAFPFNITTK